MRSVLSTAVVLALTLSAPAFARDTAHHLPLAEVIGSPMAKAEGLDGSVKFYLAGQPHPRVLQSMSEDVSNKKTNGVNKTDAEACRWVALSVLLAFQQKAKSLGANAVVDIVSYYKKNEYSDPVNYECHSGALMSGVALKGRFAKIAE